MTASPQLDRTVISRRGLLYGAAAVTGAAM